VIVGSNGACVSVKLGEICGAKYHCSGPPKSRSSFAIRTFGVRLKPSAPRSAQKPVSSMDTRRSSSWISSNASEGEPYQLNRSEVCTASNQVSRTPP
jgi:hypothetical protein